MSMDVVHIVDMVRTLCGLPVATTEMKFTRPFAAYCDDMCPACEAERERIYGPRESS